MAKATTNTETNPDLAVIIAAALASALKGANGKKATKGKKGNGRKKLTEEEKAEYRTKNDAECVSAFGKAGYEKVEPRVNVMTYKRWLTQGRIVKKGQSGIKVGPFSLFHIDQTEPLVQDKASVN